MSQRTTWTSERIAALTTPDVRQLRANAERLCNVEVMTRCDAILASRAPERGGRRKRASA